MNLGAKHLHYENAILDLSQRKSNLRTWWSVAFPPEIYGCVKRFQDHA
jgi:hypothetical protein